MNRTRLTSMACAVSLAFCAQPTNAATKGVLTSLPDTAGEWASVGAVLSIVVLIIAAATLFLVARLRGHMRHTANAESQQVVSEIQQLRSLLNRLEQHLHSLEQRYAQLSAAAPRPDAARDAGNFYQDDRRPGRAGGEARSGWDDDDTLTQAAPPFAPRQPAVVTVPPSRPAAPDQDFARLQALPEVRELLEVYNSAAKGTTHADSFQARFKPITVSEQPDSHVLLPTSDGDLWWIPLQSELSLGILVPGRRIIKDWAKYYTKLDGAKSLLGVLFEIGSADTLNVRQPAWARRTAEGRFVLQHRGLIQG